MWHKWAVLAFAGISLAVVVIWINVAYARSGAELVNGHCIVIGYDDWRVVYRCDNGKVLVK